MAGTEGDSLDIKPIAPKADQPEGQSQSMASGADATRQFRQALLVWGAFILAAILLNGTIPFALGTDLRAWTASPAKSILLPLVFYGVFFLALPLILIKGWRTVRRPDFLIPLCLAIAGVTFWRFFWPGATLAVVVLAYLHRRFDLSNYGVRSKGWKADALAVALMGLLGLIPVLMQPARSSLSMTAAITACVGRLFGNPASSVENLFYFGFMTERLSYRTGKWLTPLIIALMYTAHEISNPEYWYGGMNFVLVLIGVALWAGIYLWRRNAVVIWLGDGLYRFVLSLF